MNQFRSLLEKLKTRVRHRVLQRADRKIEVLISELTSTHNKVFLVQIGSNDGKTNDPFYDYFIKGNWSAVLVEPVPYVFERLLKTHEGKPGVVLANVAISDHDGSKEFFHLKRSDSTNTPWWYDQIGSFSRDQVMKSRDEIPDLESLLTSTTVRCLTLPQLLETHSVTHIDILHTDLEGYDYDVLRQLDFSRWSPELILYEHKHLSSGHIALCSERLKNNGYRLISGSADTLAVKK